MIGNNWFCDYMYLQGLKTASNKMKAQYEMIANLKFKNLGKSYYLDLNWTLERLASHWLQIWKSTNIRKTRKTKTITILIKLIIITVIIIVIMINIY